MSQKLSSALKPNAPEVPESKSAASDREFAAYAADLTRSLGHLARDRGFHVLTYLLDMARLEAESIAQEGNPQRRPVN